MWPVLLPWIVLILVSVSSSDRSAEPSRARTTTPPAVDAPSASVRVDFESQVRPILETSCRPCHFENGKVYASLPFDRAETIVALGDALFTRIKDEDKRATIRAFLDQNPSRTADAPKGPVPAYSAD